MKTSFLLPHYHSLLETGESSVTSWRQVSQLKETSDPGKTSESSASSETSESSASSEASESSATGETSESSAS